MEDAIASTHSNYYRTDKPQESNMAAEVIQMLRRATLMDGLFPNSGAGDFESGVAGWLGVEEDA